MSGERGKWLQMCSLTSFCLNFEKIHVPFYFLNVFFGNWHADFFPLLSLALSEIYVPFGHSLETNYLFVERKTKQTANLKNG